MFEQAEPGLYLLALLNGQQCLVQLTHWIMTPYGQPIAFVDDAGLIYNWNVVISMSRVTVTEDSQDLQGL